MTRLASPGTDETHFKQGILAGTVLLSADGTLPVEHLVIGDRIVTRSGLREVRQIDVQVVDRAHVVRIGQDMLGVGRPEIETLVAPGQTLLIRDWRAKALFGTAQALIPAERLVDGTLIRRETLRNARLFTLRFDRAEVVYAGGMELGCTPVTVSA
ncbi:MAG: Hint domain-containing protein [Paracoccaceae bacterium]